MFWPSTQPSSRSCSRKALRYGLAGRGPSRSAWGVLEKMKPIRGEVFRADCALASRGAPRSAVVSIMAKARRVVTKLTCTTPSVAVAALHGQLLAGADRAELRPERLVHLLEGGNGSGGAVATERARATVVGGVGGAGEIAARLLVFPLGDGEAAQIVEEDLASCLAVVLDVAGEAVQVVEAAPGVAIDLHQAQVARARSERRELFSFLDELTPAALLPGRAENDLPEERGVLRHHFRLGEGGVAGLGEELADLAEIVVELGCLGHPLVETVEIIVGGEGGSHEPGRFPETVRAQRPRRRLPERGRDARCGQLAAQAQEGAQSRVHVEDVGERVSRARAEERARAAEHVGGELHEAEALAEAGE